MLTATSNEIQVLSRLPQWTQNTATLDFGILYL